MVTDDGLKTTNSQSKVSFFGIYRHMLIGAVTIRLRIYDSLMTVEPRFARLLSQVVANTMKLCDRSTLD